MEFNLDFQYKYKQGVYIIKSLIDDRVYIGSTNNFRQRYNDHLNNFKNKAHVNKYMQNFVNKYGVENLVFEMLCVCENDFLRYNEKMLIEQIKPVFNLKKLVVPSQKGIIPYDTKKENKNIFKILDAVI